MTGLGRVFWLYALLWLASVLALAVARRRRAAWLLGAGLLIVMLWSACGGGSNDNSAAQQSRHAGGNLYCGRNGDGCLDFHAYPHD